MNNSEIRDWLRENNKSRLWDAKIQGLHLRKNKKTISWVFSYRDGLGKERRINIGRYPNITLDVARKKATQLSSEVAYGNDPLNVRDEKKACAEDTIRRYLDETYSKVLKGKKLGEETHKTILRHCSELLDLSFSDIKASHIRAWHIKMMDKQLMDSTIKGVYARFKTLINDAVKREHIKINPIGNVQLESYHRPNQGVRRVPERSYLTEKQIQQFFYGIEQYQQRRREERANSIRHGKKHLQDFSNLEFVDHVKPMLLLLFYTGFRPGDIRTLRWEDVRLSKFGNMISKVIEKTAHKKPERQSFPLHENAVKVLEVWNKQQGGPKTGLVFSNNGDCFSKWVLAKPWSYIKQVSGLPAEMDVYTLRHNFASWLVMNGGDLLTVARLLGHSDTQMIEQHYGHLMPRHKEEAINRAIGSMLNEQVC